MEQLNQIVDQIALTMGVGWASGINLYAAILMLGGLGMTGNITLPSELQILQSPLVVGVAGLMYVVEFFADKIPGADTVWDTLHTFIRIPAGVVLATGAAGAEANDLVSITAGLVGGGMAAGSHLTKAGTRAVVNVSPEPFTNWGLSIGEDIAVIAGVWTALYHPWLFLIFLVFFILMMIWLLPKIWRGIKRVFRFIERFFSPKNPSLMMPDTQIPFAPDAQVGNETSTDEKMRP